MKIGSIVIDCHAFDEMLAFWQEALHYVPREPATDGWVVLQDPKQRNPNVSLNRVSENPSGRNRLHLDLYTDNRVDEVKRLLTIGATIPQQDIGGCRHSPANGSEADFMVLSDPDGNPFCVVQKDLSERES